MMSRQMMGGGSGSGMMGSGMAGSGMMGPAMMRMMLTLMDTDGDGAVSLSEFQAAHERMFKAMDADKDGRLTVREVQAFFQGQGGIMAPDTGPAQHEEGNPAVPPNTTPTQQDNRRPIGRDGPPARTDDRPGYSPPAGAREP